MRLCGKEPAKLLDWQGKLADAADKLGSAWAWATIRAGSLEEQLAHLGDTYGNAAAADSDEHEAWAVRRAAWLRLVANDVRARLAGAMGRPLPTRSLTPAQEAERLNAQAAAACGPGVIPYVWVACACGALVQSREGAAKTCGACAARPMLDASEPPACVAGAVETAGDAS